MKVRRAIKKIAALGIGVAMLGATILSASAADLADFPKPLFIGSDGTFSGKFVFGAKAGAEDILGANAITAAVQAAAVLKTTVSSGGSVVTVTGDSAQIAASGDILELNERIGNVKAVLTGDDLQALKSGTVTNEQGNTKYNQYMRFETNSTPGNPDQALKTTSFIYSGKTKWAQNDNDDVGDFLYFHTDDVIFEYELEFEEGFESDDDGSDNRLEDWENRDFNILGKTFTLTRADNSTDNQLDLTFLGGEWSQVMEEGEKTTVKIGDKDYDIEVLIIADNPEVVKFKINGETTDKLSEGETTTLSDGTTLGIREILPNEAGEEGGPGDMVEFYLGANKFVWKDTAVDDQNFYGAGSTEVNDNSVTVGHVMIAATITKDKSTLTDIKYRLAADPAGGETDILIPENKGLREYMDADDGALGMLHAGWDIVYKGLAPVATNDFKIDASGDNKYLLDFTNVNGDVYSNVPFVDNSQGTFVVGKYKSDRSRFLFWVEQAQAAHQIEKNDYFIVSSKNDTTGLTHVLKLDQVDNSTNKVQFTELAKGTVEATYDAGTLQGNLVLGGKSYLMHVDPLNGSIAVDLSGNGAIAAGNKASIVLKGGGIVELGVTNATDQMTGNNDIWVRLTTLAKQFDENGVINNTVGDPKSTWTAASYRSEIVLVNVSAAASNRVDLALVNTNHPHPFDELFGYNSTTPLSHNDLCNLYTLENIDDEKQQCLTPYGVLIEYYNPTGTTTANKVTFTYPVEEMASLVFVEAGKTTTSTTGGGNLETETVVPIPSTASVLDSEVTNPKSQNLIIVGGPCANTVAQAVTGLPATFPECAAGVQAGEAVIKLLDSADGMAAGKVAMLVYGFNAKDTRLAAQVVANYKDYATKFKGKELEVTGTSLTDVVIGAPATI